MGRPPPSPESAAIPPVPESASGLADTLCVPEPIPGTVNRQTDNVCSVPRFPHFLSQIPVSGSLLAATQTPAPGSLSAAWLAPASGTQSGVWKSIALLVGSRGTYVLWHCSPQYEICVGSNCRLISRGAVIRMALEEKVHALQSLNTVSDFNDQYSLSNNGYFDGSATGKVRGHQKHLEISRS